jgi:hypothetical protein
VLRRVRARLAPVSRQVTAPRGHRRYGTAPRHHDPSRRITTGDLCRASALLLRRRPSTRSDPVSERHGVRRRLASRSPIRCARREITHGCTRTTLYQQRRQMDGCCSTARRSCSRHSAAGAEADLEAEEPGSGLSEPGGVRGASFVLDVRLVRRGGRPLGRLARRLRQRRRV